MATLIARPVVKTRADDIFFTTMPVIMLVIVVIGFAPSYFLKGAFLAPLPSLLVHIHGAVFSSWIILFVVQSVLVSAGNVRLHRKLGVLGCVLAGLMVILGILATFGLVRRGATPMFFTPVSILFVNCLGILFFGALVATAVRFRNQPATHKRLMLIANINLMSPAIGRMTFFPIILHHPFLIGVIPLAMIVCLLIFDLFTRRRVMAATVIGLVLTWAFDPITGAITRTQFAQHVTYWAQHHP